MASGFPFTLTTAKGLLPAPQKEDDGDGDPVTDLLATDANRILQGLRELNANWIPATTAQHGLFSSTDKQALESRKSKVYITDYGAKGDTPSARAIWAMQGGSSITAHTIITYPVGDHTTVLEFTKDGTFTAGHVPVPITNGMSAADVARAVAYVCNWDLRVKARVRAEADGIYVTVISDAIGAAGNGTVTTTSSVTVANFAGGANGTDNRQAVLDAVDAAQADPANVKTIVIPYSATGDYLIQTDDTHQFITAGKLTFEWDGPRASDLKFGAAGGSPNSCPATLLQNWQFIGDCDVTLVNPAISFPTDGWGSVNIGVNTNYLCMGLNFESGSTQKIRINGGSIRNGNDQLIRFDAYNGGSFDAEVIGTLLIGQANGIYTAACNADATQPKSRFKFDATILCPDSNLANGSKGHCLYLSASVNNEISGRVLGTTYTLGQGVTIFTLGAHTPDYCRIHDLYIEGCPNSSIMVGAGVQGEVRDSTINAAGTVVGLESRDKGVRVYDTTIVGDGSTQSCWQPAVGYAGGPCVFEHVRTAGTPLISYYRPATSTDLVEIRYPIDEATGSFFFLTPSGGAITDQRTKIVGYRAPARSNGISDVYAGTVWLEDCDLSAAGQTFYVLPESGIAAHLHVTRTKGLAQLHLDASAATSLTVHGGPNPLGCGAMAIGGGGANIVGALARTPAQGGSVSAGASVAWPADADSMTVTGNTQIDNFTGMEVHGGIFTVRFTGTPVLSNAGNIKTRVAYALTSDGAGGSATTANASRSFRPMLISGTLYAVEV